MTDASKLTDQELIDEMLKRFIVPQFYTRENVEDRWNIDNDDDFEIIQHELHKLYLEVDDIADEAVENIKHHLSVCEEDSDEINRLENENKKLKNMLHKALELGDTIELSKFEEEDVRTIDSFKSLNQKLRGLIKETFKAKQHPISTAK
jgi:ABC-type phosphate transport system auxiliary subunit